MNLTSNHYSITHHADRRAKSYLAVYFIMLPALLAACSMVGPDYVKPETEVPGLWAYAQQPEFTAASPQDLSQWWSVFDDSQLTSLVEESLQGSPDMRTAQARLREARARRDLANSNRFPTLSATLSGSRSRSSAEVGGGNTNNLFDAGFDASWEPDVFGGIRRGVEAAEAELAASEADLHNTQVSLAAEVALNYVELRSFQTRLGIAHDNLATQSETLQITEWREQAGLVTILEVDRARTNLEQTRATIPVLKTNLTEAENRLAILLGKPPATLHARFADAIKLPAISQQLAVGIPADTLRQRPDVSAAEQRLIAETSRIGQQTAALYPSFRLSGSFGWRAFTLGALGDSGTVASSLLASMTQTVFDAGRIRNQIRIQTAVQEQALVAYEKTILTALEEVENALVSYANNRERQSALRIAVESSRNAARLARLRFESGLIDFQTVLDTERSQLVTEESLAIAEAEGLTALVSLYKALGGGWSDTVPVSQNNEVLVTPESKAP